MELEGKKPLNYYLDFDYSKLDLNSFELANAKRLVLCIKPSTRKLDTLHKKYIAAEEAYLKEVEFQSSILDAYTSGLDKLIEKGTVETSEEEEMPQAEEMPQTAEETPQAVEETEDYKTEYDENEDEEEPEDDPNDSDDISIFGSIFS